MKLIVLISFLVILTSCKNDSVKDASAQLEQDTLKDYFDRELRAETILGNNLTEYPSLRYEKLNYPQLINIETNDSLESLSLNYNISYYLYGMDEKPLADYNEEVEIYRLIYLSTFRHPIVIKLVKGKDIKLYYKKASGVSGYYVGEIDTYISKIVNDSIWYNYVLLLNERELFKKQNINMAAKGTDGADIILECRDSIGYRYHYYLHDEDDYWIKYLIFQVDTKYDIDYVND